MNPRREDIASPPFDEQSPLPIVGAREASGLGFRSAHLIGIGGCGMSAIARAFLALGVTVSGSDAKDGRVCQALRELGAMVHIGHRASQIDSPDIVVFSSAVAPENPELARARQTGLNVLHRSEALALLLATRRSILVTGTHGKTTTSAMTALVLEAAGFDPWAFIGGSVPAFNGNTRIGGVEWAVAEADESDGTFERLPASHLIVTNIEEDHLEYWQNHDKMMEGYRRVVQAAKPGAKLVLCADDPGARELRETANRRFITYGIENPSADYCARNLCLGAYDCGFDLLTPNGGELRFELGVPGRQNIWNAVAAIAMALELGADPARLETSLRDFHGVGRRFEMRGEAQGITVIDDYAHHPTEIIATIESARQLRELRKGRIIAVFQPHRYTRTRDLMNEFAQSFAQADLVILTGIYSAGEPPIDGIDSETLADRVRSLTGQQPKLIPNREDIAPLLAPELRKGDLVLTIGAGDNTQTAADLLEELARCGSHTRSAR